MTKPYRATSTATNKRDVYEVDEIRRALKACPDTPTGVRDRFAVMLLWCTGLKTAELVSLRAKDYTPSAVKAGKREIVIPGGQRDRLKELHDAWQEHRRAIVGAAQRKPLLCNLSGGALDSSYVRHMLASLSEQAELGKRLNAQGFRNTFSATMHTKRTNSGKRVPMEVIRRQLGLSDIEYTAGWVAEVSHAEQHEAMADFSLE